MNYKKRIVLFSTGGTILCEYIPEKLASYPALSGAELVKRLPEINDWVETSIVEPFLLPGPHLTVEHALWLSSEIEKYLLQKGFDGAVVLQGTDTLEEISYLVYLTVKTDKPIVFTGAMKSEGEQYSDALGNIEAALRVACSNNSIGKGVLVVMNQEIHHAADIIKVDSESIAAFQSPRWGPIGRVSLKEVIYHAAHQNNRLQMGLYRRRTANVSLLKAYLGMSPTLIRMIRSLDVEGLVIEAFGAGNLHPEIAKEAESLIQEGITVVIATRCIKGRSFPYYGYEGGGKALEQRGFLFAGELSSVKCRLKLMLVLGNDLDPRVEFSHKGIEV